MLQRVEPAPAGRSAPRLVPGVCDVSVTNACNADCGFCGFARSKQEIPLRDFIDATTGPESPEVSETHTAENDD